MLNPAAAGALARGTVRRRSRMKPGVALRFMLMVTAFTYVIGPTVAQWVSFDEVRSEVAALREAARPVADEALGAVSQTVPAGAGLENAAGLVSPGLSALGTMQERVSVGALLMAAAIRAAQIASIVVAVIVIGFRSTLRYKPRHGSGLMGALLGRKA